MNKVKNNKLTDNLDIIVKLKKSSLIYLYNFAYEQVKNDKIKLSELKNIDLLLNR